MFKKITSKLLALVLITSIIPLALYGSYSIYKARYVSREGVIQANQKIAVEIAARVQQYLDNARQILKSLAENINEVQLTPAQKQRILRNYSINFDAFSILRIFNNKGELVGSSVLEEEDNPVSLDKTGLSQKSLVQPHISHVFMNQDSIPAVMMVEPLQSLNKVESAIVAEVNLLDLWKLVNELKVGKTGYINLLTGDGRIFASGSGDLKSMAIQMRPYPDFKQLKDQRGGFIELNNDNQQLLVVSVTLPKPYGWIVTVEQPAHEAYALARDLSFDLFLMVLVLSVVLTLAGYLFCKKEFLVPFKAVMGRIRELSQGQLEGKVEVKGSGESLKLGETLNVMSARLLSYQQQIVRKDRLAILGRVAAHLAHDLKHPVQNVSNYLNILTRNPEDKEYLDLFFKTARGEINKMDLFLERFNDLSRDFPFVPIVSPVCGIIDQVIDTVQPELAEHAIKVNRNYAHDVYIKLDMLSFQRLISNLVRNAIDAMPQGGFLDVEVSRDQGHHLVAPGAARVRIADSGTGIDSKNIKGIFTDYITTKKSGLGLGLAISQKIVQQHNGDIKVESTPGKGTSFYLFFPLAN